MQNDTKHTALVTGGAGFLGKAIVKKLIEKKIKVISFSRQFYPELEDLRVQQIQGNIGCKHDILKACKGVDTVFHVAAKPSLWGSYQDFYHTNVLGTKNTITACLKNKVKQLIYTSSPSVIFDGTDMENIDESVPYPKKYLAFYPQTKAMAEKLVKKASKSLNTIILRPHLIWGPEDNHLVPGIISRAKRLKVIGKKDDLVDTVYIDNAADAHILASEKLFLNPSLSGNIYFITQDEPVSKWELANKFLKTAGLAPINGYMSARTAYTAGALFEFVYKMLRIQKEPLMTRFAAKELATSHWFDISRAKKDLGYYPKISIKQGLKELKKWFDANK